MVLGLATGFITGIPPVPSTTASDFAKGRGDIPELRCRLRKRVGGSLVPGPLSLQLPEALTAFGKLSFQRVVRVQKRLCVLEFPE